MTATGQDFAYLRKHVHQTRIRFLDSIAKGKPNPETANQYRNAVEQYRIALFGEIRPDVGTHYGPFSGPASVKVTI